MPRAALIESDALHTVAGLDRLFRQAGVAEQFKGVGMKRAGIAVAGSAVFLVNDLRFDAALGQPQSGEHAHRSRAGDQNLSLIHV